MATMTLFEMNEAQDRLMADICDPETGEINEDVYAALEALEIDRNEKIDGWCYFLKQYKANLKAAKEIMDGVIRKYRTMEAGFDSARERFAQLMNGEKFKSTYNTIYYQTRESVEVDQDFDITKVDDDFLIYRKPDLNKEKAKAAIKLGIEVPGVHLEEKTSMVIR